MKLTGGLDELAHRRALKRWARIADAAPTLDPFSLGTLRNQAAGLRDHLDRVIATADAAWTGDAPRLPWPSGDWAWRPGLWEAAQRPGALSAPDSGVQLGYDLKIFHDCADPAMVLRQRTQPGRPPHVTLEVFDFDGSFLSLVLDFPAEGIDGLATHHTLGIALLIEVETPIEILGRLNVQQGPNTVQMVSETVRSDDTLLLEFDLAYSDLTDARVDNAWLDLILDKPAMNRIAIADLTFHRVTRAEI